MMKLFSPVKEFIKEHMEDDLNHLLLQANRYPGIDVPFVVQQIACRKQIQDKLPSWYANDLLIFPAKIATEQCSSELTGIYKQRLVKSSDHICDLTGGLGIDSYFFSQKAKKVTYIEQYEPFYHVARENFVSLNAINVDLLNGDATVLFAQVDDVDVFYIDPARRGNGNKRLYALQDCEPDLTELLPSLIKKSNKIIAKLSPMADISQTLRLLSNTTEIHILSVKNECKELIFVMENKKPVEEPQIYCCNIISSSIEECFSFRLTEERTMEIYHSDSIGTYLYEPNASVLKGGAFKSVSRLGVSKLHVNSHLYTSDHLIENFPGRTFMIEDVLPFNNKLCKTLHHTIPQANITTRNFPLKVHALRDRLNISEGGDIYLFATTIKNNERVLIKCIKAQGYVKSSIIS